MAKTETLREAARLRREKLDGNGQPHFKPESLMMSYGYKPELSEGALKCPIFQTSTFVFRNAREGKAFFELAYGLRQKGPSEHLGLIYSRLNNPDLEILENRLKLWDGAEECAVFESGMAAIATALLELLKPGDVPSTRSRSTEAPTTSSGTSSAASASGR